jgi:hypothetical protein
MVQTGLMQLFDDFVCEHAGYDWALLFSIFTLSTRSWETSETAMAWHGKQRGTLYINTGTSSGQKARGILRPQQACTAPPGGRCQCQCNSQV